MEEAIHHKEREAILEELLKMVIGHENAHQLVVIEDGYRDPPPAVRASIGSYDGHRDRYELERDRHRHKYGARDLYMQWRGFCSSLHLLSYLYK